jgi:peptidoglycan/xylan/chitin deacetylase (PgdA/CDA1 family)
MVIKFLGGSTKKMISDRINRLISNNTDLRKRYPDRETTFNTISIRKKDISSVSREAPKAKKNWNILDRLDSRLIMARISLLSWFIIPLLVVWIAINYLVGSLRQPIWQTNVLEQPNAVNRSHVSAAQPAVITPKNTPPPLYWQGEGLVTFWFDDAWESQYSSAFPILEDAGFKASLAVPTRLVDSPAYMTWPQIKRIYYKGWEINPHSRTHTCAISDLQPAQIDSEIIGSKQDLEREGLSSDNFIYITPCGYGSPKILATIRQNYTAMRTSEQGLNELPIKDPYNLKTYEVGDTTTVEDIEPWLQKAKDEKSWIILMFHQVDDGHSEYDVSPSRLREIVELVKKSNLPVVLPRQALQLIVAK